MKKTIIVALLSFLTTLGYSQTIMKISVDASKKEISVGKLVISNKTSIDEIIKELGEPERKEIIAGKERIFAFDKLAIAFDIGNSGDRLIESVTITYNYDNDKKVASGKYAGELVVDGFKITKNTKSKEISSNTKLGEIACFGNMCATNPKSAASFALMLGFTKEDQEEITQISFVIKK